MIRLWAEDRKEGQLGAGLACGRVTTVCGQVQYAMPRPTQLLWRMACA